MFVIIQGLTRRFSAESNKFWVFSMHFEYLYTHNLENLL